MLKSKTAFLIDPELVVPDDEFIASLDFWDRIDIVPNFTSYSVMGPWTRLLFDVFVERMIDCGSISDVTNNIIDEQKFYALYGRISSISDCVASEVGSSTLAIPDGMYRPLMGQPENQEAIQGDLLETKAHAVIVDHQSWDGFSGGTAWLMNKLLLLVDIEAGPKACARELIRESPCFLMIQDMANMAFPNLTFCDDVWTRSGRIRNYEREFSLKMLDYLSILNDSALNVWSETTLGDERVERMDSLGVRCSPETRETMKKEKRRKERTFHLSGKPILMDWHAKLRHNVGRLYFKVDVDMAKVYIGGVTDHFNTK